MSKTDADLFIPPETTVKFAEFVSGSKVEV